MPSFCHPFASSSAGRSFTPRDENGSHVSDSSGADKPESMDWYRLTQSLMNLNFVKVEASSLPHVFTTLMIP